MLHPKRPSLPKARLPRKFPGDVPRDKLNQATPGFTVINLWLVNAQPSYLEGLQLTLSCNSQFVWLSDIWGIGIGEAEFPNLLAISTPKGNGLLSGLTLVNYGPPVPTFLGNLSIDTPASSLLFVFADPNVVVLEMNIQISLQSSSGTSTIATLTGTPADGGGLAGGEVTLLGQNVPISGAWTGMSISLPT